jgi:hypothetical protein
LVSIRHILSMKKFEMNEDRQECLSYRAAKLARVTMANKVS